MNYTPPTQQHELQLAEQMQHTPVKQKCRETSVIQWILSKNWKASE